MAILTAAGTIGATSSADAALYYWQDSEPGFSRPAPPPQPRRQRVRKHSGRTEAAEKETSAKPQGPLIIAISIDRQKVRVYDANGFFAESPVSTGMKGHPTPMGVFSIIQKHKLHHSNIYSGAPMPFMQRITWSGVAMHAGVLPGYPASHGCIRMPMAFAVKMWNWTKMGARVIVTPGEMSPANFSHPLLVAEKIVPQPVIANEPKTDAPAIKSDKGADAGSAIKPANSVADLELRPTVGHALSMQTRTADAGGAANAAVTMSDAAPSVSSEAAVGAEAKSEAAKSEPVKSEAEAAPANSIAAASADNKAAEATSSETKSPETANGIEPKTEQAEPVDAKPQEVQTGTLKADATKIDAPKAAEKDTLKAAENPAKPLSETPAVAPDAKKDGSRLPGAEKTAAAKAEPPKRTGQISVFVSRKDGKLYVRQNFSPLFEVPVTIAPSERMLGTHVFTAETDKNDPNKLRWSVVTLPVTARNAAPSDDDERSTRRRKVAGGTSAMVKSMPAPDSAAEALDRITIPADAMARIAEALTTGSSIVVSDQGINQGETGEGTDFIVSLR